MLLPHDSLNSDIFNVTIIFSFQADVGQSLADSVRSLLFELQDLFEQPQWESPTSVTKLKSVLGDGENRVRNSQYTYMIYFDL